MEGETYIHSPRRMPAATIDMKEVYDLLELKRRIESDARSVKREEKLRFVELAKRAERNNWAEKAMGGPEVLPDIIRTRELVKTRLAA